MAQLVGRHKSGYSRSGYQASPSSKHKRQLRHQALKPQPSGVILHPSLPLIIRSPQQVGDVVGGRCAVVLLLRHSGPLQRRAEEGRSIRSNNAGT